MSQGGEKTEQPTEKRLRDAKKKGQVAKSQDLSSAVLLIVAVMILWGTSGYIGSSLKELIINQINFATSFNEKLTTQTANDSLWLIVSTIFYLLTGIFGAVFVMAFLINFLQVGPLFSTEAIKPNFSKLNPAPAFQQKFFKSRPYIEVTKTIIKIIIATVVVGTTLWDARGDLIRLTAQEPQASLAFLSQLFLDVGLKVGIAYLLIGGADFFLQKMLHKKENKMSKKEVKDEYKESEGDPYIKYKRRQIHREIIAQGMSSSVKKSSVVVANPTHVAVAIKYERGEDAAPVIVAKGADLMAAKIREIATESNVPIMQNIPLARALFELDIDDEVPEDLYETVAVVLKWVYEQQETKSH
jgi:type III secretion YscU/HrpY family protein